MITVRELADRYRLPNHSVVEAIQGLSRMDIPDSMALDLIAEIRGITHKLDPILEPHVAQYALRYLFQDQMTSELAGLPANPDSTYLNALNKARKYITENPWVFATKSEEDDIGDDGKPVPKKGDKKVLAKKLYEDNKGKVMSRKEWIELLVKEVGLTPAGASTYYANLKSGKY